MQAQSFTGNEPMNATGIVKRTQLPESKQWIQEVDHYPGLTIRQHFAALALQGIISGLYSIEELNGWGASEVAKHSVEIADALIAQLNK